MSNNKCSITPLLNYLVENNLYKSFASGENDDVGLLINQYYDIPKNRLICITPITSIKIEIAYYDEDYNDLIGKMIMKSAYDFNIFDQTKIKKQYVNLIISIIPDL